MREWFIQFVVDIIRIFFGAKPKAEESKSNDKLKERLKRKIDIKWLGKP